MAAFDKGQVAHFNNISPQCVLFTALSLRFEVELHGPTQVILKEPGRKVGGHFDQSELWPEEGGYGLY